MEGRRLGRTGHLSSVAILGGAAFWDSDAATTATCFGDAMAAGVNHLDVAPQYGRAQQLLGPLIPPVRDRLFVACKTMRHHGDGVRAQFEESLGLLGCDHFDLYQLHAVNDLDELESRADAITAILAAREEGLCRWAGITGHDLHAPATHLEALRRHDLDTVMFPVNARLWSDPAYRHDAEALLSYATEHDIGVMAIKAAAARPWGARPRTSTTWYEPHTAPDELAKGVNFALSVPGVAAICMPGDVEVLAGALRASQSFTPMDAGEREEAARAAAAEACIFPMPV
jgi:aryl-alcohol dehydrogenase-like predicted oxidoreductase